MRGRNQCKGNLVQERQKQFLEVIRAKVDEGNGDRGNTAISSQIATGIQPHYPHLPLQKFSYSCFFDRL